MSSRFLKEEVFFMVGGSESTPLISSLLSNFFSRIKKTPKRNIHFIKIHRLVEFSMNLGHCLTKL